MARLQLEFIRDKLEALKELAECMAPEVSKPLRAKLGRDGNEKSVEYEQIKKFLI